MSSNNNSKIGSDPYSNIGGSSNSSSSKTEEYEAFQRHHQEIQKEKALFHERLESKAQGKALEACILVGAFAAGLTVLATKRFNGFNRYMSLSAKTALPVSAGIFAYCYQYELTTIRYIREPVKYGLIEGEAYDEVIKEV